MTTKHARYDRYSHRIWEGTKLALEARLTQGVAAVNRVAASLDGLEERTRGVHIDGHAKSQDAFRQLKAILEEPMTEEGETLAKLLDPNATILEGYGYDILRFGFPVPFLQLVKLDSWGTRRRTIIKFLAGEPRASRRFSAATPNLLMDARGQVFVDASGVVLPPAEDLPADRDEDEDGGKDDGWRDHWRLSRERRTFVTATIRLFEFFARNGFAVPGMVAEKAGLWQIRSVMRLKALADYTLVGLSGSLHDKSGPAERAALAHVAQGPVLERLVGGPLLDPGRHRDIAALIKELVTDPVERVLALEKKDGSTLGRRSLASIELGLFGNPLVLTREAMEQLRGIEQGNAVEAETMVIEMLANLPPTSDIGRPRKTMLAEQIDAVDLESSSGTRRMLAASHIQKRFLAFHESVLAPRYSELMLDYGGCPMPLSGVLPVEIRMKAAVGAQLMGDFQKVVPTLPAEAFDISHIPMPVGKEEEKNREALKAILTQFQNILKQRFVFEDVKLSFGAGVKGVQASWLAYFEENCTYRGCGISGLGDLIFPCMFFSDTRFELLVKYEYAFHRDAWLKIRGVLSDLPRYYRKEKKDWVAIRRNIVLPTIDAFTSMALRFVRGIAEQPAQIGNPLPTPTVNPFARPASFLERRHMAVAESNAPIEVVAPPPGNAFQYQALVARNAAHIRRLKNTAARPSVVRPLLVHARERGPLIDPNALSTAFTGRIFRDIKRRPRKVPNRRHTLLMLMDFSGSMGKAKVDAAKDLAITLAEAFANEADIFFYLYTTGGPGYRLIRVLDSRNRSMSFMASLAARETESGTGGNPDAAALLAAKQLLKEADVHEGAVIAHIADFELCPSLNLGLGNAEVELHYAVRRVVPDHHYIAARVGTNADPIKGIDHDYLHLGDGNAIPEPVITGLVTILRRVWGG